MRPPAVRWSHELARVLDRDRGEQTRLEVPHLDRDAGRVVAIGAVVGVAGAVDDLAAARARADEHHGPLPSPSLVQVALPDAPGPLMLPAFPVAQVLADLPARRLLAASLPADQVVRLLVAALDALAHAAT